ncbi:MAG: endonuclease [Armatimonadetes bacterium]|nr:endonuclease [Armatimonadota bacterium]
MADNSFVYKNQNRYVQIIESIFHSHFQPGMEEVDFAREEIIDIANSLGILLPKNIGDIIYSFRYRTALPDSVRAQAPAGKVWIIRPAGRGRYKFVAMVPVDITANPHLVETKIPDATPGIIEMYASGDEQSLLAKLRYNRLLDIFTGITCYSLQNHLRTTVPGLGQVETDEVYIGIDRRGAHYVLPVQAKAVNESLGIVQIEQDIRLCAARFRALICRPIAAKFMEKNLIALFAFEETEKGIAISHEKHYRLIPPEELSLQEIEAYRNRPFNE